jgi:hypothetical protein
MTALQPEPTGRSAGLTIAMVVGVLANLAGLLAAFAAGIILSTRRRKALVAMGVTIGALSLVTCLGVAGFLPSVIGAAAMP